MFEEHENCLFQNEKNVVLNENSVEGKPCIKKEIKILKTIIYLYKCYDEHNLLAVVTPPSIYHKTIRYCV